MNKISTRPCPICKVEIFIISKTKDGESLASCGHKWSFKKTRSQKDFDRKYVKTANGYELVIPLPYLGCAYPGCSIPVTKNSDYCIEHKNKEN